MEFGVAYTIEKSAERTLKQAFEDAIDEIRYAEDLGYTTMMISSQHFEDNDILPSPFVACAVIAARTERIRVGPGILVFPLDYHPVHVAEDAALLDVLSGGRLVLGIGQGGIKKEFAGFQVETKERRPRLSEGVKLIRRLWTEESVTHSGRYWNVKDVALHPKPLQKPHPPIWVAGEFERAIELAGEIGDGWFADPKHTLLRIRRNYELFREAYRKTGRDPDSADFAIWREIYVAESDEKAWEEAGDAMRGEFMKYLSWGHLVDDEGNILSPDRTELIDDLVRDRFVVGGPERCIEALQEYKEMGITHFIGHTQFTGLPSELVKKSNRILMEKVAPHL